jgi:diguanylate cyclase (GGDEF)-like protein
MDFNDKPDGKVQWLRALAQPTTYLGVAMLAAIGVAWTYLVFHDRREAKRDAIVQGENLVRLFENSISRALKSADQTVLLFRRFYEREGDKLELHEWVRDPALKNELTFQFNIVGADGRVKKSTFGPKAIGIDISDREHFKAQSTATDDKLIISKPVTLRTSGKRALILSRRLTRPGGKFNGIVAVSIDVDQLEKYHRVTELGENGLSTLTGLDGVIRTAGANGKSRLDLIGRNTSKAGLFRAFARSPVGSYWNTSNFNWRVRRLDAHARLVSYRQVDGFPLIAAIGRSEDVVFQHANENRFIHTFITFVLTIGIVIAIVYGAVRQKRLLEATREITRQAHQDDLTGLANRAAFRREIDFALERAKASSERFNILLLDLDHFKSVNDTLGHAAGDDLIRMVARRLVTSVRAGDVVARLGGDELAILQRPRGDAREAAVILASRLIEVVGEPYDLGGHQATIETSIGVARSHQDGDDANQLLKCADLALYRAKSEGRNIFRLFDSDMEVEAKSRFETEADLRVAIAQDEFDVYYQPLVNALGKEVCAAEALIRWHHPRRGTILPGIFIPVAESTGLIVQLGELVLRRACMDAATWPPHVKVAVNLSPV